jgi:hypothetical protein
MRRISLYSAAAVVLFSAVAGTYRITVHGMRSKPCPSCGRLLHVNSMATGTYLTCNRCVYSENQPVSGAFSWVDALEYLLTE